jgi:hypothetical protein
VKVYRTAEPRNKLGHLVSLWGDGQRVEETQTTYAVGVPNRIVCKPGNAVSLPVREPDKRDSADPAELFPAIKRRSARVFSLEEHKKKKMSEKRNDD